MTAADLLATKDPRAALTLLRDALEAAAAASMGCTRNNLLDATGNQLDDLVRVLADASALADRALEVRASAQAAVLALLPGYSSHSVDGVGTVTRRSGTVRKTWDHDRVRSLLVTKALDNLTNEDGEVRHNPATIAKAVEDALAECGHVDYWRAGKLSEFGIDADSFCTSEKGAARVEFMPASGGQS